MQSLPKFLDVQDVEKLINAVSSPKSKVLVRTIYTLGLRVSECTNIELLHINHQRKTVRIYGKGNKERILPIPEALYLEWTWLITRHTPKVYLFENAFGDIYNPRRVREIITVACQSAKIEHTWPHKLRHSRATQLLNAELPLPSLQRFLGHVHLNTTAIYTHLAIEPLRKFL